MRYPRQVKIFRGHLSAAPLACVLLLLLIFVRLGSLLYIPGVLINLNDPAATIRVNADGSIHFGTNAFTDSQTNLLLETLKNSPAGPPFDLQVDSNAPPKVAAHAREIVNSVYNPAATILVSPDGSIHFGTNTFTDAQTNLLREALRNSPAGPPFYLRVDPAAPRDLAANATDVVNSIFLVSPPPGPRNLIGTDNPTVIVAVNFLGQYIFDNKIVDEPELKAGLTSRLQAAARESKELTLTIAGDAQVNWSAVILLTQWARETGIKQTVLAEWPAAPSATPAKPSP
jgi:biopolymer transport protein ExbD